MRPDWDRVKWVVDNRETGGRGGSIERCDTFLPFLILFQLSGQKTDQKSHE